MNEIKKNENNWNWRGQFLMACEQGDLLQLENLFRNVQDASQCHARIFNDMGFRLACRHGHIEVLEFLLKSPAVSSSSYGCCRSQDLIEEGLRLAVVFGQLKTVQWLLVSPEMQDGSMGVHPPCVKAKELRWASIKNQTELVRWLIEDFRMEVGPAEKEVIEASDDMKACFERREKAIQYEQWMLNMSHWSGMKW